MDVPSSEMTLTAAALLSFAGGVILCFLGYRLLKVALAIVGFVLGASLATALVGALAEGSRGATMAAMVVGGVLGAVILVWALKVGIFLVGAVAGALLGGVIAGFFGGDRSALVTALVALALALVGGLAAVGLQRVVIGLSTAIIGGAMIVTAALEALFGARRAEAIFDQINAGVGGLERAGWVALVAWVVLSAAGASVQIRSKRRG